MESKSTVQYEDFATVGDGATDDMEAICADHDWWQQYRCGAELPYLLRKAFFRDSNPQALMRLGQLLYTVDNQ